MATGKYEYVNIGNYLFLTFLRIWAGVTAIFFFRRYKVVKEAPVPRDHPVIFAVNHQSAFLDPVLIGISCGRKPWYLTRAGVFQGKFVKFLLRAIHMLPVYRQRDNVNVKHANEDTFDECVKILGGMGSVLIFPEGNHGMLKYLRTPLKKGLARIVFEAESTHDFQLGVQIIPVGINYEHPTKFRTDVLINCGKPYSIKSFKSIFQQSRSEAFNQFNRDLEERMSELMLNITPVERYDQTEKEWMLHRRKENSLLQRFNSDKKIIAAISAGDSLSDEGQAKTGWIKWIMRILGLPIFIAGFVLNLPVFIITRLILKKSVRDPHFLQSVKFVCAMAGVPLFSALEAGIIYSFFGTFWIPFFAIPLLGIIAYDYWDLLIRGNSYVPTRSLGAVYLPE
ncbi:1-acyl-sn-glycerol-3-phosphate acyltransferase [Fulvivirga sedimenti]|uniref:1-acyl-sn-glycerol-3-phosphate acyltransferase n=1 Tax=Fulvivirga sedimenti TaxID=2879465 RepID=A0A9X1HUT1_9BACT|nr:1-acyl-sn-glycerol-3-phosphate acyltransferase [Fulvivirga sedimenti]MCA6075163.1 1-acyl-sn-glycerol-3-phosphate acyltransferase [Fulvivirga sedimenti]MCA6076340.1 1-acyl-sn-glycerol-3-phosphate acyltransferase [Fulvivirga sedimenti]MCA6077468.1 1-acyl-sn-glycerol-3-phosphate acyltransferase [Fulvivirga sedimenti]